MKKLILACFCAVASIAVHAAAASGSCESKAESIKSGATKTVKLVNEYDPEDKSNLDYGAYYLAVTLNRGKSYTVWVEGATAAAVDLMCYAREPTDSEWNKDIFGPSADFGGAEEYLNAQACYLSYEDWDYEEDPSSWKYYIYISGDIGTAVKVGFTEGIKTFVEPGTEENPKTISFSTNEAKDAASFGEGDYYYRAYLTAGRKYLIRTVGGTEAAPLSVALESGEATVEQDADYASDVNNEALVVYPEETGYFIFTVTGVGANFQIAYKMVGARSLAQHPTKPLALGESVRFTPTTLNESNAFYDQIVDGNLYKISLEKGDRAVFKTVEAVDDLKIYVYDSKGTVLATNESIGNGSKDVLAALEATAKGVYYVGVCDPTLAPAEKGTGGETTLMAVRVAAAVDQPIALSAVPAAAGDDPTAVGVANGPHKLSQSVWENVFALGGRKGITYQLATLPAEGADTTDLTLAAEIYTLSGTTRKLVATGNLTPGETVSFTATANLTYYVSVSVAEGQGLEYPDYEIYAAASSATGEELGILTVLTKGAPGTWTLDRETVKYSGGVSILAAGSHTVTFQTVKGFAFQGATKVTTTVAPGTEPTIVEGVYADTFDPKDDTAKGATKLTISNKETVSERTLWATDAADWFSFAAKDGIYYNLIFRNVVGAVKMRLLTAAGEEIASSETGFEKLPLATGNYNLVVEHAETAADAQYALVATSANVGAIKFAKTAVSVKEDAAYVELTVNRTAKEGALRVRYGTVAGTAQPGVDYVAQSGILSWDNGKNDAKKLRIALIPDLIAAYEGNKTFAVKLLPMGEDELGDGEYLAAFAGGSSTETVSATVTLTETARAGTTPESAYKPVKPATVKTEAVALYSGTFTGVLVEDGSALTNGLPALGSITFTASTAGALSAKIQVAGKSYTFSARQWGEIDPDFGATHEFEQLVKIANVPYVNTLRVTLNGGKSNEGDDWRYAGGTAELVLNVPDADGKGVQEDIVYVAELVRDNSKIQDYLTAVADYAGYYTIALAADPSAEGMGLPEGNGYLTMTIDTKGKAKFAGQLADGTTKPTYTTSVAIRDDGSLFVPLFFSKSPCTFGGAIRVTLQDNTDERLPYEKVAVVDSSEALVWNNDNAALTRDGLEGWRLLPTPVGGWYDTVFNLQAHYLTGAFSLDGAAVTVAGNNLTTEKNASGETTSAITFTYKRATGLTSGTLTYDGTKSVKHCGVMILARDPAAPIEAEVLAPGAFTRQVTVQETNAAGRKVTRKWIESLPFDLRVDDLGEIDWWAEDWGE